VTTALASVTAPPGRQSFFHCVLGAYDYRLGVSWEGGIGVAPCRH
jgi:hypothetical protein